MEPNEENLNRTMTSTNNNYRKGHLPSRVPVGIEATRVTFTKAGHMP